jgi:hypothetical protein
MDTRNPCRGDLQSALGASARRGVGITNACLPARGGGGVAVRAEALRSLRLYPVNYKFVPPGTKNGAATVRAMRMGAPAAGRGAEHVWALWGSPLQRLRRDSLRRCRPSGYGASHVGRKKLRPYSACGAIC